jgi:ABC-type polysaccharide/polyol phosphate transport system ATPase subunit
MEDYAIVVNDLSKSFKINDEKGIFKKYTNQKLKYFSIKKISFSVKTGEILGIIGTNGSGKTTLLRLIAGVYTPDTGDVKINGRMSPLLQLGVGFQGELDAKDNIIMNSMLLGISKNEILKKINDIISYAELENFVNLKLKHYSSGMRARLAFSTAMQINPDILLIDEIMSVGDKNFRKKSYEAFLTLKKNKKTIVHVSHNLKSLEEICDRILLLDKGKFVMLSEPEEVIKKYNEMKPTNQI